MYPRVKLRLLLHSTFRPRGDTTAKEQRFSTPNGLSFLAIVVATAGVRVLRWLLHRVAAEARATVLARALELSDHSKIRALVIPPVRNYLMNAQRFTPLFWAACSRRTTRSLSAPPLAPPLIVCATGSLLPSLCLCPRGRDRSQGRVLCVRTVTGRRPEAPGAGYAASCRPFAMRCAEPCGH